MYLCTLNGHQKIIHRPNQHINMHVAVHEITSIHACITLEWTFELK